MKKYLIFAVSLLALTFSTPQAYAPEVYIYFEHRRQPFRVEYQNTETVADLIRYTRAKAGIENDKALWLPFNGRILTNEESLEPLASHHHLYAVIRSKAELELDIEKATGRLTSYQAETEITPEEQERLVTKTGDYITFFRAKLAEIDEAIAIHK